MMQVVTKLHNILKPFMLRRVKSEVESCLPGKMEIVLYAPMTPLQQKLNQQLLDKSLHVRSQLWCDFVRGQVNRRADLP